MHVAAGVRQIPVQLLRLLQLPAAAPLVLQHMVAELEPSPRRQGGGTRHPLAVDECAVGGTEIRDDGGIAHYVDTAVAAGHSRVGQDQVRRRQATYGDRPCSKLDAVPRLIALHHNEVVDAVIFVRGASLAWKASPEADGRTVDGHVRHRDLRLLRIAGGRAVFPCRLTERAHCAPVNQAVRTLHGGPECALGAGRLSFPSPRRTPSSSRPTRW